MAGPLPRRSSLRRVRDRLVEDVLNFAIEPRWLQIAIVPLVQITHQLAGFLAKDVHDRFASEAGIFGQNVLLNPGPRYA